MTIEMISSKSEIASIKDIRNATPTNTEGKNKYVVALLVGGLMEMPDFYFTDYQIINADNENDARCKYNEINKCRYFYGSVICKIND